MLLQVSVAVLLDNFVSASARIEEEAKQQIKVKEKEESEVKNPLEPLLIQIMKVTNRFLPLRMIFFLNSLA